MKLQMATAAFPFRALRSARPKNKILRGLLFLEQREGARSGELFVGDFGGRWLRSPKQMHRHTQDERDTAVEVEQEVERRSPQRSP